MKRKEIIFTCLFASIVATISILGCKKSEVENFKGKPNSKEIMTTPLAPTLQEVQEQLQWIARGYPDLISSGTVLSELKSNLSTKEDLGDIHDNLQSEVLTSISVDLEANVWSKNVINFGNPNGYIREYFFDYDFNDCIFKTGLRILDTVDNSLPWVVTYETHDMQSTFWGYYINNGTGNLDSISLDSANYQNYLVFVVFSNSTCDETSDPGEEGCNENGVCEPMRGETVENCADCQGGRAFNEKTLKVVVAKVEEDVRTYENAWNEVAYHISWDWWIADGSSGKIHMTRQSSTYPGVSFNKWKKREVPRDKPVGSGKRGTVTEHIYHWGPNEMFLKFIPANHDIYIRFWEEDRHALISTGFNCVTGAITPSTITFHSSFSQVSQTRTKGGSFHNGGNTAGPGEGVILIPAGSTWNDETIDGDACAAIWATTPNGEISIKLAYIK